MSLKNFLTRFLAVGFFFLGVALGAEEYNLYIKTSPVLEYVRPFSDPATISILVTASDGKPVRRGWIDIRLDAPVSGRFFTTDMPLVEGSRMLAMRLPLRQGRADWKYLFPIRGEYRLEVELTGAEGEKASKFFYFRIREHPSKWLFLALFTLVLFFAGVAAGRVFTSTTNARANKGTVALLLFLGALALVSAYSAGAQNRLATPFGSLRVDPATVGKPTPIRWRLMGEAGETDQPANLTLTITHLEKRKMVFEMERIMVAGEFLVNFHFPDGAEYRISATANIPGRQPVRTEQIVSVTGVEPPFRAMAPAIAFFLSVIVAGLLVGRWSRRRQLRS